MKMEENEETSVISLRVNSEQKEAIIQFFNFNDWDLNEVNQEDADSNIEETEFERTFRISQNENCEECQHCLCRPCITDEKVSQSEKYSIHGTSLEVKSLIAELLIFIRYYYLFIYLQKKRISIQKLCHRAVTAIMCGLVSSLHGHTTR